MDYKKAIKINFLIILILLMGLIGLKFESNQASTQLELQEDVAILNLSVADIAALALKQSGSSFGFINRPDGITIEPPLSAGTLSPEKAQSFLYSLSKLAGKSKGVISDSDLPTYGLENPQLNIIIILANKGKMHLLLGNQNSLTGDYYLIKEDDHALFTINQQLGDLLLLHAEDFTDFQILPHIELNELNSIDYVEIKSAEENLRVSNQGNFVFSLTTPVVNSIDYEQTLSQLIFPLIGLQADEIWEGSFPDSKENMIQLNFGISGENYHLKFFPQAEGGYLLNLDGQDAIYRISKDLGFLNINHLDLLDGSIYHSSISEIQDIVIRDNLNNQDYNFHITGESTNVSAEVNGKIVNYPELMDFFTILLNTDLGSELVESQSENRETGAPSFTFEIFKKSGSIDTLAFYPNESGKQILYVNGRANFTSYTKTVLNIQNAIDVLLDKDGQ